MARREFVAGIPEWFISVALIENGKAVAGGISNPATSEVFLGAVGHGIKRNGQCRSLNARASPGPQCL
jgi:myo-inositol-1(or 4)-monophosphatase